MASLTPLLSNQLKLKLFLGYCILILIIYVIATKVYDNMTIAESEMENKHSLIPDYLNSKRTSALKEIEKSVGALAPSRKELNVNLDEIQGLPMSDKPIQIGDSVQKRQ